jgi:hypothetical protein
MNETGGAGANSKATNCEIEAKMLFYQKWVKHAK